MQLTYTFDVCAHNKSFTCCLSFKDNIFNFNHNWTTCLYSFMLLSSSFPPLRLLVCAVLFLFCPMNKIKIPQSPAVPRAQHGSAAPDSRQSFHGSSLPDFNVLTLLFHTGAPTGPGGSSLSSGSGGLRKSRRAFSWKTKDEQVLRLLLSLAASAGQLPTRFESLLRQELCDGRGQ